MDPDHDGDETQQMSSDEEDAIFETLALEDLVKMIFDDSEIDEDRSLKLEQSCAWEAIDVPLDFLSDLDEDTEFVGMCLDAAGEESDPEDEAASASETDVNNNGGHASQEQFVSSTSLNEKRTEPSVRGSGDHELRK